MERKKKFLSRTMLLVNVALVVTVCVLNYFYQVEHFNYALKVRTSNCFALIGIVNLLWALWADRRNWKIYLLMCLGLVLARQGDIAINRDFVIGAAVFAAGHVLLAVSYCVAQSPRWRDLLFILPLAAGSLGFLQFYPYLFFTNPARRIACFVYAVIISVMLGKAAADFFRRPTLFYGLLVLGSALFFFSDFMLLLDWFVGKWRWTNNACMATYYPAVCLLGVAMYAKTVEKS